jgi:hypothetical protein
VPNAFWGQVDRNDPPVVPTESDRVNGKHIRLAAASQFRAEEDGHRLDLLWQRISWLDHVRTNARFARQRMHQHAPLWAWFDSKDLVTPPTAADEERHDVPLANRLAINLAVILRPPHGDPLALLQFRGRDLAVSGGIYEAGASESVHGDRGWPAEEQDVRDGHPNILRTARRCLWQELALSGDDSNLWDRIPTFEIDVRFTALVLNKKELTPRLLGYALVRGSLEDCEKASRSSRGLYHSDFKGRPDKDAVPWDLVRPIRVTREGFAWVFENPQIFTPECRARLLYYGKSVLGDLWDQPPGTVEVPPWWDRDAQG